MLRHELRTRELARTMLTVRAMPSTNTQCWRFPVQALYGLALVVASCNTTGPGQLDDAGNPLADSVSLVDADTRPLGAGVVTLAGSSVAGHRDGWRTAAQLSNPVNVAVGPTGDLFVADFDSSWIRKVTRDGLVTTVLTGPSTFKRPFGLLFAPDGTLYAQTDMDAQGTVKEGALWTIDLKSGKASLVMDRAGRLRGLVALPAPDSRLVGADYLSHVVMLFDRQTKALTLLAGASGQRGYADGTGFAARFSTPYDVVLTSSNELIVADQGNHRLRKITLAGEVSTWAGDGVAGKVDGPRLGARFNGPEALAIDAAQNVYVTEAMGRVVRKITGAGQVTTIAGDGKAGFVDASDPLKATFYGLEGLDVTSDGRLLYIADGNQGNGQGYNRVRRMTVAP